MEFDLSHIHGAEAASRCYRWTAKTKARVSHEKYGEVIVPHRSNLTAIENAAEFWRCDPYEIISTARVDRVPDDAGPVRKPKEFCIREAKKIGERKANEGTGS